ncbi:MAG: phosphoesterase [Thermoprotei archaeon]|nr:MAG: phosphoesterase [Thermoprotei archaeon]
MKPENIPRVLIAGDWDADGVIAAALVLYSQEKLGKYPIESKAIVDVKPLDPERIRFLFKDLRVSYDAIVLLDIPYFNRMENILKMLKKHFDVGKIIMFDHHISTLVYKNKLRGLVDELYVGRDPTAKLVYDKLREKGIQVTRRLKLFVETVTYMDKGLKIPPDYVKMFEIVSLFSKALTVLREEEIWVSLVKWLANPLPIPIPLDNSVRKKIEEAVRKRDEELKNIALDLAVTARKVGYIRFIDARRIWKKRGSTALASKIGHILKSPVAVLFSTTRDYDLLIIKASKNRAYRIAKFLLAEGIAQDIAGHPNLAIVRIPKTISIDELLKTLHKASLYM